MTRRSSLSFAASAGVDKRPRIHLWPALGRWRWSDGPSGMRSRSYASAGDALNAAVQAGLSTNAGAIAVVEPGAPA